MERARRQTERVFHTSDEAARYESWKAGEGRTPETAAMPRLNLQSSEFTMPRGLIVKRKAKKNDYELLKK